MMVGRLTTTLEGKGYQAFWGPHPVAWDQSNFFSLVLTGNAKLWHVKVAVVTTCVALFSGNRCPL